MWLKNNFFKYAIGTILVLLIILLLHNIEFLFAPVFEFIAILFIPILIAGILYFVLRPLVWWVENVLFRKMYFPIKRPLAIFAVYLFLILAFGIFSAFIGPTIVEQIASLTSQPSEKLQIVKEKTVDIMNLLNITGYNLEDLKEIFATYLIKINNYISDNILDAISTITKFTVLLVITPFVLFYFLKDDQNLYHWFMRMVPVRYQREAKILFRDIDVTLSTFITGQLIVAFCIGLMLLLGYSIIGLNYATTLAIFAMFFFTIPMVGSFIAIIPALLVGLGDSPWMVAKVAIVMSCVLILESNFISPQIMSQRLHIHPVALILILLASGTLYGVLGLFLATPVYALLKVIIGDFYHFYYGIEEKRD